MSKQPNLDINDVSLLNTKMKRSLSIEVYEPSASKKPNIAAQNDDDDIENYVTPKTSPLNDSFRQLKELFPDKPDKYLLRVLARFTNRVNQACEYLLENNDLLDKNSGYASRKTYDVIIEDDKEVILINDDENDVVEIQKESWVPQIKLEDKTQPKVESNDIDEREISKTANKFQDANLILNLFPSIELESAIKIAETLRETFADSKLSIDERNARIVEHIIVNNLNQNAQEESNTRPSTSRGVEKENDEERQIADDFEKISMIVVDCDPSYLIEQLKLMSGKKNRVELILSNLLEDKKYPKLKDYIKRKNMEKELESLTNMQLNMEEFLKMYPNPVEFFYDKESKVTDNYTTHSRIALLNKFIIISRETIDNILAENKFHFTPTYRQLEDAISSKEQQLRQRLQNHLDKFKNKTLNVENYPPNYLHERRKIPPSILFIFIGLILVLRFFFIYLIFSSKI